MLPAPAGVMRILIAGEPKIQTDFHCPAEEAGLAGRGKSQGRGHCGPRPEWMEGPHAVAHGPHALEFTSDGRRRQP
jgi:hypothetical protein